jgi:hypothetical protein
MLRMRNILYIATFYCLILILVFVGTYMLGSLLLAILNRIDNLFNYLILIMPCILISYLAFSSKIQYKKLVIIVGLWGLALGGWMLFLKRSKLKKSK